MKEMDDTEKECSQQNRGYRPFLLMVLFLSLYLAYLILGPFVHILVLAIVLASLFYPVQMFFVRLYRGRKNLAALTIVFIITFALAIPVFFFVSAMVAQGLDSINQINEWLKAGNLQNLAEDPKTLRAIAWAHQHLSFLDLNKINLQSHLMGISKSLGQFLLSKVATLLGNAATLVSDFFIMIFIVFYLVRDGKEMMNYGRYYSPLRKEQEDRIFDGIGLVARSVLLGSFLTALAQGLVGGIGLAFVSIPGLFWGTVMGFASLIPIVGTSLVWIPTVIYLVLLGKMNSAIFLLLWCVVLMGIIDNFLRPFLMKGEGKMSPFFIFLAIIGGVQYFGLAGILYGPLILSFAMIMLYIYGVEYREDLLAGNKGMPAPIDTKETKSASG